MKARETRAFIVWDNSTGKTEFEKKTTTNDGARSSGVTGSSWPLPVTGRTAAGVRHYCDCG